MGKAFTNDPTTIRMQPPEYGGGAEADGGNQRKEDPDPE